MDNLDKVLEGLLFLAGDGLDRGIIMEKLQVTPKQLDKAIEKLKERYNEDCGINFITYKDKLQLCASPAYADEVSLVLNPIRERQLTKATLEVMAIIAYKQPVTRIDVQEIRGINSDYAMQTLLNYKLIEVVGRKDAVGKPLLFGTTDEFLRHFGINSLDELPDYDELMKSVEAIQLENNHLYNEFDIESEEKTDDKIDVETFQSEHAETELENASDLEVNAVQNINENIEEKNQDLTLEEMAENMTEISNDNQNIETKSLEEIDGIDWSLLENNPDIENE